MVTPAISGLRNVDALQVCPQGLCSNAQSLATYSLLLLLHPFLAVAASLKLPSIEYCRSVESLCCIC